MSTREKIEAALNEARMMILGGQVVLGFQFNAIFQPKFEQLPIHLKWMNAGAVALMIGALCLLLAPAPFHRLAERGDLTDRMHNFTTAMIAVTPLPFALAIGMDVLVVNDTLLGLAAAIVLSVTALVLWYGVELMKRRSLPAKPSPSSKADLHEKIKTINTEARMILPGVQALLGFQFSAFLTHGFDKLPEAAQHVHFIGLIGLGLAAIFLMAPAAYHRIAARGEDHEDVDSFAVVMVLGALIPLTVGFAADLYLVLGMVTHWAAWTAYTSCGVALATWLLWFGYPLSARRV